MRIYFSGIHDKPDAPSVSPVDATEAEAKEVLAALEGDGGFIGLQYGSGRTLQIYKNADATLHAEILNQKELTIRFCAINTPLGEMLIEAAFRGEDFERKIAFARPAWRNDTLKKA